jgi:hypothetical protein
MRCDGRCFNEMDVLPSPAQQCHMTDRTFFIMENSGEGASTGTCRFVAEILKVLQCRTSVAKSHYLRLLSTCFTDNPFTALMNSRTQASS